MKKVFLRGRPPLCGGWRRVRQLQQFLLKYVRAWWYKYTNTKLLILMRKNNNEIKAVHQFGGYELIGSVKLPFKISNSNGKVGEFAI